jgi:signal transduction histidine kinase
MHPTPSIAASTDELPRGAVRLSSGIERVVAGLRALRPLDGLTDEEYGWLAENSIEFRAPRGTRLFDDGDRVSRMIILMEGDVQVRRRKGGQGSLFIARSGALTGLLPFSRMKTAGGTGTVSEDLWALLIDKSQFPDMLAAIPSMAQRCVHVLIDRVREMTRLEQQAEKLSALGKLAANLAHELNNPASAARRAASNLMQDLRAYGSASYEAGKLCLSAEQQEKYRSWNSAMRAGMDARKPAMGPLLTQALEERLIRWMEQHGVANAWEIAPVFAEAGIEIDQLAALDGFLGQEAANLTLVHLAATLRAERMTATMLESTARIFDLIRAIQEYSHMDQAPLQDIDLAQSLESTLAMLHYRLHNVEVEREYEPELPSIAANGSELNQVWMALMENALDAMRDQGTLRLCTGHAGDMIHVDIRDDGPGIPPEIRSRIFEPFFTTKPAGPGQGLGLDTVQRILTRYNGSISVESEPGKTCFRVRLPLEQPGAY